MSLLKLPSSQLVSTGNLSDNDLVHIRFILMADKVEVSPDGKVSLLGVFNTIYAKDAPCRHGFATLIVMLSAPINEFGNKYKIAVKLLEKDGKTIFGLENDELVLPKPEGVPEMDVPLIFDLEGLIFPAFGEYSWKVEINGHTQDRDLVMYVLEIKE